MTGKKGRLAREALAEITARLPGAVLPGVDPTRRPGRSRNVPLREPIFHGIFFIFPKPDMMHQHPYYFP